MNFRLARPAALIDINRVKELAREILSSNLVAALAIRKSSPQSRQP
jgi:hypothetical protein